MNEFGKSGLQSLRRRRIGAALVAAPVVALTLGREAMAQNKPITIVLTVPAGTSIDALARQMGERLRAKLDRTVLVESRAGGGGAVAVQYLKQGPTDGSLLMLAPTSSISMHKMFSTKPSFDPATDLAPISEVAESPHTITVNKALGVDSFPAYVEYIRKNPTQGSIGTPSLAGLASLLIYQMGKTLDLKLQFVPYKGGQPLLADLLGNQIPAAASVLADYLPEHRNGRLKILAHASNKRSELAPDIPTFKELGYPFYEARTTFGFYARKGTPDAILQNYSKLIAEALATPDLIKTLSGMGLTPMGTSPQAYQRKLQEDERQWEPIVIETGLKIN